MDRFRVFLSAVSSELKSARRDLRDDLATRGCEVSLQEELRLGAGDTLLHVLDEHIRQCQAVVCLIGRRSGGGYPTETEAAPYAHLLPSGIVRASYTQWEFLLARCHGMRPLVCCPRADFVPDKADADLTAPDDAALQIAFADHVTSIGIPRIEFSNMDELGRAVLRQIRDPARLAVKPVALPYPTIGTLFKGRDDFLAKLRARLTRPDGKHAAISGNLAVHGLGGIGKTRAAVEYAWAHQDDYTALLFAVAETPDAMTTNLANLTGALGMANLAVSDTPTRLQAVLDWLNRHPGWLLILDNVDSDDALATATALVGRLTQGIVLLTSRLANIPDGFESLELDVLTPEDAAAFLLERTDGRRRRAPDDPAQALDLARELGQLALALTHAAAYIRRLGGTLAEYRTRLATSFDAVMAWSDPKVTHYPRAIAATWALSFDSLPPPARALLERLAFLSADPFPDSLLTVPVPGADAEDGAEALADLVGYSLATRDAERPTFSIHRLVLDVTRRGLDGAAARARLKQALGWVNAAFEGEAQDVRSWSVLDPLAVHAEAVAHRADAAGLADPTARLMNQLGMLFDAKALPARAEPLMRRALAIDEASYGDAHPRVAIHLNNLAQLLQATNRLGEAEPLMHRALAIDEASYGDAHPNVATHLNNLAQLLQATNRLGEAEPLMRRVLAIDEASYGDAHPRVARDLNNFATLLQATNRLGEAEPLMRRALAIDEASYGDAHPNVAIHLNNLAQLLQAMNRLGEAEPLMRRALAIDEASYGDAHPRMATHLNNLAQLLQATNRLGEAEPLMRRALAIDEASYRDAHPRVAIHLSNLAGLLQATNRLGEAEPLMRRALAIDEASYGDMHPLVAIRLNNLAQLLQATNRLGEAEPLMRRALAIDEASYGDAHPDVARDLNNLAALLRATNRLGEAEPSMRRHVVIFLLFQLDTGHAHPHRDAALNNYAILLREMGRSEAEIDAEIQAMRREAGLA